MLGYAKSAFGKNIWTQIKEKKINQKKLFANETIIAIYELFRSLFNSVIHIIEYAFEFFFVPINTKENTANNVLKATRMYLFFFFLY